MLRLHIKLYFRARGGAHPSHPRDSLPWPIPASASVNSKKKNIIPLPMILDVFWHALTPSIPDTSLCRFLTEARNRGPRQRHIRKPRFFGRTPFQCLPQPGQNERSSLHQCICRVSTSMSFSIFRRGMGHFIGILEVMRSQLHRLPPPPQHPPRASSLPRCLLISLAQAGLPPEKSAMNMVGAVDSLHDSSGSGGMRGPGA